MATCQTPLHARDPLKDRLVHHRHVLSDIRIVVFCKWGNKARDQIYSSLKSSNVAAGVKTSSSPITCRDKETRDERGRSITAGAETRGVLHISGSVFSLIRSTNILVFHVLEQPEFPVRASAVDQGLKRPGELLHRNLLPQQHVIRRTGGRDTDRDTKANHIFQINLHEHI